MSAVRICSHLCAIAFLMVSSISCATKSNTHERQQMTRHKQEFVNQKKNVEGLVAKQAPLYMIVNQLPRKYYFKTGTGKNWELYKIVKSDFGYGDAIVYRTDQSYPHVGYGGALLFKDGDLVVS